MNRITKQDMDAAFAEELRQAVKHKLDEINHYVAGVNSPFTDTQIRHVQEYLGEIEVELGIKVTE